MCNALPWSGRSVRSLMPLAVLAVALAACSSDALAPDATATIGPEGGTLRTSDDGLVLEVPAGALTQTVTLTARALSDPDDPNALSGTRYDLRPNGTEFATPATLTLRYDPAELRSGLTPEEAAIEVAVVRAEPDALMVQPSINDAETGSVSAEISHFSEHHVTATGGLFLPPIQLAAIGQTTNSISLGWNLPPPLPELAAGIGGFPATVSFVVERAVGSQSPPQTDERFTHAGGTRAFTRSEVASGQLTHTDSGLSPQVDDRVPGSGPQSFFTYRVRVADGYRLGLPSTHATGFLTPSGGGGTGGTGGTGGAGGTGGTGGAVDPCDVPLPQVVAPIDLKVDVYAVFNTRQGGISFDAGGNLFVGNFGRDPADDPSRVFRVSPGGAAITESIDLFEDPDVLLVDVGGLEATAGNVLIGGSTDLAVVGQLHEMTPNGQNVGTLEHMCLRNIGHLIFDRDDRLLVTNFNPAANVCAVKGGVVTELIADVVGGGPAGLTVQDPDTGDLFVTSEDRVHRYDSDGALLMADYATGGVLAYGPAGSLFEGLLIRRSGTILVRPDPESEDETALLMDSINGLLAFDANDNLYISDWPNGRVLRVSPNTLPPTAVGCP